MSRRHSATKRPLLPDAKYGDVVVNKFVNSLMRDGKKGAAERVLYGAMGRLEGKAEESTTLEVFRTALENIKPKIEVRSRRVGGSTYQIPVEVREDRRLTLAIRWLIKAARDRSGKSMKEKLSAELLDAFNNRGTAIKKREDTHKMAEANRAFAHYMW